jgi:hypothetical protein
MEVAMTVQTINIPAANTGILAILVRLAAVAHQGWTERRDFPAPAAKRFRDWWHKDANKNGGSDEQS